MTEDKTTQQQEGILKDDMLREEKKPGRSFLKRYPVMVTIICGLLLIAAVYGWKELQAKKIRKEYTKAANEQLLEKQVQMLKVMARPLVWSIRGELLRNNLEQANIFTTDMVREQQVRFIHVIDVEGNIILSTDKKLEGQPAAGIFDSGILSVDSVEVRKPEEGVLELVSPVMGYDRRLATLLIRYHTDQFEAPRKVSNVVPD